MNIGVAHNQTRPLAAPPRSAAGARIARGARRQHAHPPLRCAAHAQPSHPPEAPQHQGGSQQQPSRREALQLLAAIGAALGPAQALALPRPAAALTVADVTPAVVASPPLPPREQAIVDGAWPWPALAGEHTSPPRCTRPAAPPSMAPALVSGRPRPRRSDLSPLFVQLCDLAVFETATYSVVNVFDVALQVCAERRARSNGAATRSWRPPRPGAGLGERPPHASQQAALSQALHQAC